MRANKLSFQMDEQCKTIEFLLKDYLNIVFDDRHKHRDKNEDKYKKICFVPFLNRNELEVLEDDFSNRNSRQDIVVAGAYPKVEHNGHFHLEQALSRVFANIDRQIPMNGRPPLQEFLLESIEGNGDVNKCDTFDQALNALKLFAKHSVVAVSDDHIGGLRISETQTAIDLLNRNRIVILSGAPGIGKSAMAEDIFRELESDYEPVTIFKANTVAKVVEQIQRQLEFWVDQSLSEDERFFWVATEPRIIWIRQFDKASLNSLVDFINRIRRFSDSDLPSCVVESREPLVGCESLTYLLGAMTRSDIFRLLQPQVSGGHKQNIEEVCDEANGNPSLALNLWRATPGNRDIDPGGFHWLEMRLGALSRKVLVRLVFAMENAPLGLSREILDRFIMASCPGYPPVECRTAIGQVIQVLEDAQLLNRTQFSREVIIGDLGELVPEATEMEIINSLDRGLMLEYLAQATDQEKPEWMEALKNTWIELGSEENLAEISLCLVEGDLAVFLRSTFCFTSLNIVLDWIERSDWVPSEKQNRKTQFYILKCLRLLSKTYSFVNIDIERSEERRVGKECA